MSKNLDRLRADYLELRDPELGKKRIKSFLKNKEDNLEEYFAPWYKLSKEARFVYPSQGLLTTPYDYLDYTSFQMLPQESLVYTLRLRRFFLEMYNHPYRMEFLHHANQKNFDPVPEAECVVIEKAARSGLALSIGDLGASITGTLSERVSRTERYASGPFVKLGKQARTYFIGSSSPDVWNSAAAISTMAACHCLCGIPRNGLLFDIKRQADVAKETFDWIDAIAEEVLAKRSDRKTIVQYWKNNVMGTLEASSEKALARAKALYASGVRTFRVYSPEPGSGTVNTVIALRKKYGNSIEIFAGQIVDIKQAKRAEEAGADGIFVGIGGGGRCITGVRSGSLVDWPELIWKLRGEIKIPVIVEGGATDHVAVSLLLGASGISVSRAVAGGTIESPGGALFCVSKDGKLFKPYGGEASARTKFLDLKLLPFDTPSFVEGETTKAQMSYIKHTAPTLTYNLHLMFEDAVLALVFRGVQDIYELHKINPSPIRRNTSAGDFQRNSH